MELELELEGRQPAAGLPVSGKLPAFKLHFNRHLECRLVGKNLRTKVSTLISKEAANATFCVLNKRLSLSDDLCLA